MNLLGHSKQDQTSDIDNLPPMQTMAWERQVHPFLHLPFLTAMAQSLRPSFEMGITSLDVAAQGLQSGGGEVSRLECC